MMKQIMYFGVLIFLVFICISCSCMNYEKNKISIATIIRHPENFINKTVELEVRVGGDCWWVKRQGNICVTDGTSSLCAMGELPKEIPTRPWQKPENGFISLEKMKTKKMWIKGVIKAVPNKQFIKKADNVVGGKLVCKSGGCTVRGGLILYIKVLKSHWID